MVSNDKAILDAVADELRNMGHKVDTISEDKLDTLSYDLSAYDKAFGMLRDSKTILLLLQKNDEEKFINSLYGILDCNERVALYEIFMEKDISIPSCALYTKVEVKSNGDVEFPFWIKRGEGCAEVKEDTSFVTNDEEASKVIDNFKKRDIPSFIAQQHIEGDLIKFYGVEGTDFFDWDYASKGHSKFGLEEINGKEHGYTFNPAQLKSLADLASKAVEVPIYGGDCVVDSKGNMYIIDFNDWPSFSRCRDTASRAIAERIMK